MMINRIRSWYALPILAYHRVGQAKGDHVPTISPETFEYHLGYLRRHRYEVLSFEELVETCRESATRPARAVAITFDDGYEETYTVAWPILKRYGFRATVFLAPAEMGLPGFMNWEQARAMSQDGFAVGSHTMHHLFLPHASPDLIREELESSKRVLEQELGRPVPWLSYPVGGYTREAQAIAQAAGYRAACTTNRGVSRRSRDLFAIRRVKMTERDRHPIRLWAKVSGYYDCFRTLEPPS